VELSKALSIVGGLNINTTCHKILLILIDEHEKTGDEWLDMSMEEIGDRAEVTLRTTFSNVKKLEDGGHLAVDRPETKKYSKNKYKVLAA